MQDQLSTLEQLQVIDTQIRKIEKELKSYPEEISRFNHEMETKKESISNKKSTYENINKEKIRLEIELKTNNENIKKSEDKLFEIKTHKEYEALQKEITETKRNNAELEEQILIKMEKVENLETEIKEDESQFSVISEDYSKKISNYEDEIKKLNEKYSPIKAEKESLASKVEPKVLALYQRIVDRSGVALALTENEVCTSCKIKIPPQLYNEVLTQNNILQCPNCKKILYTIQKETS